MVLKMWAFLYFETYFCVLMNIINRDFYLFFSPNLSSPVISLNEISSNYGILWLFELILKCQNFH